MRSVLMLCLLAALGPAHAQSGFSFGQAAPSDSAAQPMAWRYATLAAAHDVFEQRATRFAPNAVLSFRLPTAGAGKEGDAIDVVELVDGMRRTPLPMASSTAFMLVDASAPGVARVEVNRSFAPGAMLYPHVRVRSHDLPPGVLRMGDLRLACQAQFAMAKTEGLKAQALLEAASLLGFDACNKLAVPLFDTPGEAFDTIVVDDGARHASLAASGAGTLTLGDKRWSDNARIYFTMDGRAIR